MGPTVGTAGQSDGSGGDGRPLDTDHERWTRSPGDLTGNLENAVCWAVAMVTGISAAELLHLSIWKDPRERFRSWSRWVGSEALMPLLSSDS